MASLKCWICIPLVLAGCADTFSRGEASRQLEGHLAQIAPAVVGETALSVLPSLIVESSETSREVRFRVTPNDLEGRATDTTGVLAASFSRSDRGWILTGYGPDLARFVAKVVARARELEYEDLLQELDLLVAMNYGNTRAEFEELAESLPSRSAGQYLWAYEPDLDGGVSKTEVSVTGGRATCQKLDGRSGPSVIWCHGRTEEYMDLTVVEEVLGEIAASGGIFRR